MNHGAREQACGDGAGTQASRAPARCGASEGRNPLTTTNEYVPADLAYVPIPAGAREVDGWDRIYSTETPDRYFRGTRREAGDVHVEIHGCQRADGSVRYRSISIWADDGDDVDSATAREIGNHLLAAADELDRDSLSDAASTIEP